MSELYDKIADVAHQENLREEMFGTQVSRTEKEILQYNSLEDLKAYVVGKAREFESLRKSYETQLSWLRSEVTRLGVLADAKTHGEATVGYVNRDQEWLKGLEAIPDAQAVIVGGLVDIPQTIALLKERLK